MRDKDVLQELGAVLRQHGMLTRGSFTADATDEALRELGAGTLILVGNAGADLYRAFGNLRSTEPNPLDAWTRRVMEPIARRFGATALFPFGGPPYWPFQRWAMRAEGLKPSPLGILIHPEYGLWHAYRAALLFPAVLDLPQVLARPHPCDTCAEKPCLATCPVSAITPRAYDADKCARHVASEEGADCRDFGCLARRACPIGRTRQYPADAMAFHMAAFLAARRRNSHQD
ncbi:MAG TPA: hypothetical protein VMT54_13810 [Candidatus Cybelea sp.]|nr:hypothetical protein [Candidatus Cybelea sp.]